ncbi:MAG: helix-turn-helix domain-containing protein [Deltaproteobacteria bacterium]|nr:helix-turn-helix domain-containing protein [Deltaproteobacteria bacterium]
MTVKEPTVITVKDLAARFGCHPESVRRLVRSGKLSCFRVGRAMRFRAEDVEAYEKWSGRNER